LILLLPSWSLHLSKGRNEGSSFLLSLKMGRMDGRCLLRGRRKDEERTNLEGSKGELDLGIGEIERWRIIESVLEDVALDHTRDRKAKADRDARRASKRFVQTDDESIGKVF